MKKYPAYLVPLAFVAGLSLSLGYSKYADEKSPPPKTLVHRKRYHAIQDFDQIANSALMVHSSATLEQKCKDSFLTGGTGGGILLEDEQTKDKYVLSTEHITEDEYKDCKNPVQKIRVLQNEITVEDIAATIVKEDEKNDLVLFKLEGTPTALPFKGKVAKAVYKGNYVLGIGFPNREKKFYFSQVNESTEDRLIVDLLQWYGFSGGPVFLSQHEHFELIGVPKNIFGGITPVQEVQEFVKGTVLEDDYIQK